MNRCSPMALREVDAAAAQAIGHVLISDEFRHGLLAHAPGDPHDRFESELVDGVSPEATNEVAIDFEIVEWQVCRQRRSRLNRADCPSGLVRDRNRAPGAISILQVTGVHEKGQSWRRMWPSPRQVLERRPAGTV